MENETFLKPPLVIDNGSGYIKVGFSGDDRKPLVFPSIVGRPKYSVVIPNTTNQFDVYMGEDLATQKRGLHRLNYPIRHGVVEHWDDMELLWKHAYSLMKVSPSECPVLLTEANMNPLKHRSQMLEIFFQKFQVPAVFVAVQGVLSLFATGKSTGIVLDSGDGVSHVIPVYEGYALNHACERMDLGGRNVTQHLQNLMKKSGINLSTSAEFEIVKSIKEKYCVISANAQKSRDRREKYFLPDGQAVEFSNNEKDAGEILFSPDRIGLEYPSIVQLLANSLGKVDIDLRMNLYNEIILSGGNTNFEGFPERFVKELKRFVPEGVKTRILAPAKRETMCWEGGSILASLPSFKGLWMTRAKYQDQRDHAGPGEHAYSKKEKRF